MEKLQAILFDCDGVLAETERDGHRVAYNTALKALSIDGEWSVEEYAELVRVSGGKERLRYYFNKYPDRFPPERYNAELIQRIYQTKTELFKSMAVEGKLPGRSGIGRLVREAREAGVRTFVCSTSHEKSVATLILADFGQKTLGSFTALLCGDVVAHKKPAPDVYLLAAERYGLEPKRCLVVEDSRNGLLAAKAAGMNCLMTPSYYTRGEDFSEADAVVSALGDPNGEQMEWLDCPEGLAKRPYVDLSSLMQLVAMDEWTKKYRSCKRQWD